MYYDAAGNLRENYYGEFRQMFGGALPTAPAAPAPAQEAGMSPPIREARIIQVKDKQKAKDWNVTGPQMFMTEDEEYVLVKQPGANGYEFISYKREPPEPDEREQFIKGESEAAVAAALKKMAAEKQED